MAIQRLTAAYRSRSRPSSTLGAKASTVCPYYLDGDLLEGEPKFSLGDTRLHWLLCSFQGPRRGERAGTLARGKDCPPAGAQRAGLSKLNSMRRLPALESAVVRLPGPVDMSSDRMRSEDLAS
jgi:hypothetical protein